MDIGFIGLGEMNEPAKKVVLTPRGHWHGYRNSSDEVSLLIWDWSGVGSLEAAGYEVPPDAAHAGKEN